MNYRIIGEPDSSIPWSHPFKKKLTEIPKELTELELIVNGGKISICEREGNIWISVPKDTTYLDTALVRCPHCDDVLAPSWRRVDQDPHRFDPVFQDYPILKEAPWKSIISSFETEHSNNEAGWNEEAWIYTDTPGIDEVREAIKQKGTVYAHFDGIPYVLTLNDEKNIIYRRVWQGY